MNDTLSNSANWPYFSTLLRLCVATVVGVFIGLERERRGKAGLRTFAFASLLGCIGSLLGDAFALVAMALLGVIVVLINWEQLARKESFEITTSVALLVTGLTGILCGKGHTFTPVAVAVVTTALLAWKRPLTGFVLGLREAELRSAILLAILSFVVYPVLPTQPVDPWSLINPRETWSTVILIAALGFVNYVLWKIYGKRSIGITGLLGGLVNSTAAAAELSARVKESGGRLLQTTYRGIMLATSAMILRNGILLGLLALSAVWAAIIPLSLMLFSSAALAWVRIRKPATKQGGTMPALELESPFSLSSALKFGLVFLVLQVAGTLAQRFLGAFGFYVVTAAGALFSSASAVASAATLAAHHKVTTPTAADGVLLASITSALVNIPIVARITRQRPLIVALSWSLFAVAFLGLGSAVGQRFLLVFNN